MKNHFPFFFVIPLIMLVACQETVELTDDQKASIVSEVDMLYSDAISKLSKLDIDLWSEPWSVDAFISVNSGVNYFSNFNEWRDSVEFWFSLREAQKVELFKTEVTVLTSELALLTSKAKWEVQFKNQEQMKVEALGTLLWKKETDSWKIIHLHESWQ